MTQMLEPERPRRHLAAVPAAEVGTATEDISGVLKLNDALEAPAVAVPGILERFRKNVAFVDGLMAIYFALMLGAVAFGTGPGHDLCTRRVIVDIVLFATGLLLTRGGIIKHGTLLNEFAYRATVFCSVFLTYFQLREILPAVSQRAIDADILAFDLKVFGVEPSLAWDRFVNPTTTEWFAFFYFGYFFILILFVLPMMFNARNEFRVAQFTLGMVMVYCTGHLVYMLVPGWGPYKFLGGNFEHPLQGGLFWSLVKATVDAGGAQKDIFPSLHTAAPTYFAIFSYLHRKTLPFKFVWPVIGFCATQIILATMFLRWHYLVDILAGLTLATASALLSYKIVAWETKRRRAQGAEPIFRICDYPWEKPGARSAGAAED